MPGPRIPAMCGCAFWCICWPRCIFLGRLGDTSGGNWYPCQHLHHMRVTGMHEMRIPVGICNTWAQGASGTGIPVSICTTCVWQEWLQCSFVSTFAAHGLRRLLELASRSAFAPHVCSRTVWNVHSASICSTRAQEASGIGIPVSICTTCVWQECLERAFLPAFAAHQLRRLLELASLSTFSPHVCLTEMSGMRIPELRGLLELASLPAFAPYVCLTGMSGTHNPASVWLSLLVHMLARRRIPPMPRGHLL